MAHTYTKYSVSLLEKHEFKPRWDVSAHLSECLKRGKTETTSCSQGRWATGRRSLGGMRPRPGGSLLSPCGPAAPSPGTRPRDTRIYVHTKHARSFAHNGPDRGATSCPPGVQLSSGPPDRGTLFTMWRKKCRHTREVRRHHAEWKKSASKGYVLDDSIYMTSRKGQNAGTEDSSVARGWRLRLWWRKRQAVSGTDVSGASIVQTHYTVLSGFYCT